MNDTEAKVQRVNISQQGANGESTRNSGSSEEFQRDSAQLNLGFTAISSVVLTLTLVALAFGLAVENNWTIRRELSWIILAVLFVMVLVIFGATQYAVCKTNRLPLDQLESKEIYMLCFAKLNLIFKAVSSVGSILTFIVVGISAIKDDNWINNKVAIALIIFGLSLSGLGIIYLTVQTVRKAKSAF